MQERRKINKWTRFLTVILSFLQSALFAKYALQMNLIEARHCCRRIARYYNVRNSLALLSDHYFHDDNRNDVSDVGGGANH